MHAFLSAHAYFIVEIATDGPAKDADCTDTRSITALYDPGNRQHPLMRIRMTQQSNLFYRTHRYLWARLFYPMALSTLLVGLLLLGRRQMTGLSQHRFLVWNLLLAWIPYFAALCVDLAHGWLEHVRRRRLILVTILVLFSLIWLFFLPNAPYLLTDFIHVQGYSPIGLWYDIGVFSAAAWTGCFLGVSSLFIMQTLVQRSFGKKVAGVFVTLVITLSGFGVYLGRFMRSNSWHVATEPHELIADLYSSFSSPLRIKQMIAMNFIYSGIFLISYLTFLAAYIQVSQRKLGDEALEAKQRGFAVLPPDSSKG